MQPSVRNWLLSIYALVVLMVMVGGVTRLTGSGLSMVEWRPLMGALPPLGESQWQAVFQLYQGTPQFEQVNGWMTLADFKSIFFWEYLHRLLGRSIGVVFLIPWLYFIARKQLTRKLAQQTAVLFVLGGLQGVMGWYMVMSGLVDRPEVSHFRLAAHLSLALIIAQGCVWLILEHRDRTPAAATTIATRIAASGFLALVSLQVVYGAFMAGMRAGLLSATFPLMNGEWFPTGALSGAGLWHDLVANAWMVHFVHRGLGWLVFFAGCALAAHLWGQRRRVAQLLLAGVSVQFILGVLTVMLHVRVPIAVAHQVGGALLLSIAVLSVHSVCGRSTRERP